MRLYSLVGADSHVDPEYGRFTPDEAGGFDFPDEVSDLIGGFAVKGNSNKPMKLWETEMDRADRLHGMEMARRRDPASMLAVMEENSALLRQLAELNARLAGAQLAQVPAVSAEAPAAPEGDCEPDPAPAPAKPARAPKAAARA